MKKLIAMLLTLALVASLGVTALAAGSGTMPLDNTNLRAITIDDYIASLTSKQAAVLQADSTWLMYRTEYAALVQKWTGAGESAEQRTEFVAARAALNADYAAKFEALAKAAGVDTTNYSGWEQIFRFDDFSGVPGDWDGKTSVLEDYFGVNYATASTLPFADLLTAAKDVQADNAFYKLFGDKATTGDIIAYIQGLAKKTEEPATEEPATEEPATEEPATEEPATEEPATEEPATEEPATEEPATEEPATVDAKLAAILKVREEVTAKMNNSKAGTAAADELAKEAAYNKAAAQAFVATAKKAANDAKASIDVARKAAVTEAQAAVLNAQANAYATLAEGISKAVSDYVVAVDKEIVSFYNSINAPETVYDYSNYPG